MYLFSFFLLSAPLQEPSSSSILLSLGTTIGVLASIVAILIGVTALWRGQKRIIVKQTTQEIGQQTLTETVEGHSNELKKIRTDMDAPSRISDQVTIMHRLDRQDLETQRLEALHLACSTKQQEKMNRVFGRLDQMRELVDEKVNDIYIRMDKGFDTLNRNIDENMAVLNKDIKDILKNTK